MESTVYLHFVDFCRQYHQENAQVKQRTNSRETMVHQLEKFLRGPHKHPWQTWNQHGSNWFTSSPHRNPSSFGWVNFWFKKLRQLSTAPGMYKGGLPQSSANIRPHSMLPVQGWSDANYPFTHFTPMQSHRCSHFIFLSSLHGCDHNRTERYWKALAKRCHCHEVAFCWCWQDGLRSPKFGIAGDQHVENNENAFNII